MIGLNMSGVGDIKKEVRMNKFILRYKLFIAIVAADQRVTVALRKAGLASSFLDMTKEEEDMNPYLTNLASLCRVLLIYPSDLFHPSMDKVNTKSIPHPPRPELKDFYITEEDFARAFRDLLDKRKFCSAFRYETYYGLIGRNGKRRSTTLINASLYMAFSNKSIYEFFLHVENIARQRIAKEKKDKEKNL